MGLNNTLSGLVTYPDLLLMDLPEDSPWQKPLSTIQRSGQKAAAIVQDLLSLTRQGMTEKQIVSLNQIVTEYLASPEYGHLLSNHSQVRVDVALDEKAFNTKGSPFHISKALMNLLHNACEANLVNGIVQIATQNRYFDRPHEAYERIEEGEYVVLSVADTGIGINQDDLTKIFEPFYSKKKLGRSGTGLGMTLIWSTVKDLGGFIDIQTEEGRGSTFSLYFPVTRDVADQTEMNYFLEDCRGTETVLVVDDVREQREIASVMLRKLGYGVQAVSSGEAAIERFESDKVDILLLDMIMEPGIDGCETYRRIVADHPGQKAIIASGFTESERVKEAPRRRRICQEALQPGGYRPGHPSRIGPLKFMGKIPDPESFRQSILLNSSMISRRRTDAQGRINGHFSEMQEELSAVKGTDGLRYACLGPPLKPRCIVKPVALVGITYLETEEDVDNFLRELRNRLAEAVRAGQRVQIR